MRTSILVPLACAALVAGATARAETPALRSQRTLDGHVFQPSFLARTPFAAKSFDVALLYGLGEATAPRYDIFGDPQGERQYSFAAMGQSFAYEAKLAEGISAGGGLVTSLYSGTDSASALVVGADIQVGVHGHATAGRRVGPVHAAATLDLSYGPRLGIVVIDAVRDAIDSDQVDEGKAVELEDVLTVQPGVAAAWAPHPALGVTASIDFQWLSLEQELGTEEGSALGVGVAADLDFGKLTQVPVALVVGFHLVEPLSGDDVSTVLDFSLGGFYTAKPELVVGVEIGWREFEIRPGLDSSGTVFQVRSAYYW